MNTETKKVYDRYKKIFIDLDIKEQEINEDLIKNIAFMVVTLNKLQEEIDEKGVIEKFEQGKQNFLRESPALKSYNITIKNFNNAIKTLNSLLPKERKLQEGEELLKFIAQ